MILKLKNSYSDVDLFEQIAKRLGLKEGKGQDKLQDIGSDYSTEGRMSEDEVQLLLKICERLFIHLDKVQIRHCEVCQGHMECGFVAFCSVKYCSEKCLSKDFTPSEYEKCSKDEPDCFYWSEFKDEPI